MKNKILLLIISLLLIPTFVYAKDTCNDNDIKIKSIALKELNGFSEEIQESSINNNTINLNLKMYDVGDSSTYDITVENTSSEDYYFTKDSMKLENDYLEYSLKNDSELIPSKEEKTIELKVSYKNKIPNDSYSDTSKLIISLSDKPLENPKTKMTYTFIFIIFSLIAITIYTKITNKSVSKKKLLLIGTSLSIIPITTTALCTVNLNVETKIEIESKEAVFLPGKEVNIKMKELAGDDTSTVANGYGFKNESITTIRHSNREPLDSNKEEKNIVSTSESSYPIYMWYEDGTIYWWSEDKHPSLNEDASYMFGYLLKLNNILEFDKLDSSKVTNLECLLFNDSSITSIKGLENWDVSNAIKMGGIFAYLDHLESIEELRNWNTSSAKFFGAMFFGTKSLKSLKPLENWNTSNVTSFSQLFYENKSLVNLEGLENWDTSSANDMSWMFWGDESLFSIKELKKWDVSNVKSMLSMFMNNRSLESLDGLQDWNTSSLTQMGQLFYGDSSILSIKELENWDVSNVVQMYNVFTGNSKIESVEPLTKWNTQNVTTIFQLFTNCSSLKTLKGLETWDVSKVTNFSRAFRSVSSLYDSSAINDWNIMSTSNFSLMFGGTPTHPEFTKVQGTWSGGTFTPTP